MISAVAPPVPLDPARVVISSDWQRRCVLADFGETFFASLEQAQPDWLVVDLIDSASTCWHGRLLRHRSSAFQAAGLDEVAELDFDPSSGCRRRAARCSSWPAPRSPSA